jgi:hypothetical protein
MLNGHTDAYVRAAINGEVARLASAGVGERNQSLFKSTAALASLGLREGEIIRHLKPVAEEIGLRGRELYSTIKSGVRAGESKPRTAPNLPVHARSLPTTVKIETSSADLPERSPPDHEGRRPIFFAGQDHGPRYADDEVRRHVYRREGIPVRIKVKRRDGFVNWYRVNDNGVEGWQAGKPEGYRPCPYVGAIAPFDAELEGDVLYWPEGEKDCDALGNLAWPVFTFGGTGDGLPDGIIECVRGRQLVILADNDKTGREHATKKAQRAWDVAATIKVVQFPELPPGGDVSDYLATHTEQDLQRRVDATPLWQPPDPPSTNPANTSDDGRRLLTCSLADVVPEKIEWLWPGRVAAGKLTMIAGEPGLGKSQLAIAIAAAVTTGGRWPDCDTAAPLGSVIILSAEDGLADTIKPRFDAAGGDSSRVTIIRAVQLAADAGADNRQSFNLSADLALLEAAIRQQGDGRLVLIDPVSSYLGKIDSHKNADVRSVLGPLSEMAERLRVAILAITHLSKGDGKAINRVIGSVAFVAAARTAFAVVADPDDDACLRRLFLQVKNNIATAQSGLAFRLEQREVAPGIIGSAVAWDETHAVTMTVDQALSGGAAEGAATAKDEAIQFLTEILAGGPVDVLDIEAQARTAAMLPETRRLSESKPFRAASSELRIIKQRQGFGPGARMQWSLPSWSDDDPASTGGARR